MRECMDLLLSRLTLSGCCETLESCSQPVPLDSCTSGDDTDGKLLMSNEGAGILEVGSEQPLVDSEAALLGSPTSHSSNAVQRFDSFTPSGDSDGSPVRSTVRTGRQAGRLGPASSAEPYPVITKGDSELLQWGLRVGFVQRHSRGSIGSNRESVGSDSMQWGINGGGGSPGAGMILRASGGSPAAGLIVRSTGNKVLHNEEITPRISSDLIRQQFVGSPFPQPLQPVIPSASEQGKSALSQNGRLQDANGYGEIDVQLGQDAGLGNGNDEARRRFGSGMTQRASFSRLGFDSPVASSTCVTPSSEQKKVAELPSLSNAAQVERAAQAAGAGWTHVDFQESSRLAECNIVEQGTDDRMLSEHNASMHSELIFKNVPERWLLHEDMKTSLSCTAVDRTAVVTKHAHDREGIDTESILTFA